MVVKYVGADVHSQYTQFVGLDKNGRVLFQQEVATEADLVYDLVCSIRGEVRLAVEEGTQSMWLYGLLSRCVKEMIVCNRQKQGGRSQIVCKSDFKDAFAVADGLRLGTLLPVFKGYSERAKAMKQLATSYSRLTGDVARAKSRVSSLYHGVGMASCTGMYSEPRRTELLRLVPCPGIRSRLELLYAQLDAVGAVRKESLQRLVEESKRHQARKLLLSVPGIGAVRAAQLIGVIGTPHRFPDRQNFWSYCGLAVVHLSSGTTKRGKDGRPIHNKRKVSTRGLNLNRNPILKNIFKGAEMTARRYSKEFAQLYDYHVNRGLDESVARVHLARKLASITLSIWKKGVKYDPAYLKHRNM